MEGLRLRLLVMSPAALVAALVLCSYLSLTSFAHLALPPSGSATGFAMSPAALAAALVVDFCSLSLSPRLLRFACCGERLRLRSRLSGGGEREREVADDFFAGAEGLLAVALAALAAAPVVDLYSLSLWPRLLRSAGCGEGLRLRSLGDVGF